MPPFEEDRWDGQVLEGEEGAGHRPEEKSQLSSLLPPGDKDVSWEDVSRALVFCVTERRIAGVSRLTPPSLSLSFRHLLMLIVFIDRDRT